MVAALAAAGVFLAPFPEKRALAGNEQAIRDALKAGTGVIRLPPGRIDISSELAITAGARDLEIRGAGSATVLRAANTFHGSAMFHCTGGGNVRFSHFAMDGNRQSLEIRAGLPAYNVAFSRFTANSGILAEDVAGLKVTDIQFVNMAGFAILASRSRDISIERVHVRDSGSRDSAGGNNGTGGILLEEGTANFRVLTCVLENIRGNGVWTHSLYTSPRNANGRIALNFFRRIGRDAVQIGHATDVRVEDNIGESIGFPITDVDLPGRGFPVALDTAGNTDHCAYIRNRFEEINGKCIDLDGFHDGEVRGNTCRNRGSPDSYPYGHYGIVMNNSNPDMRSENVTIMDNFIDGTLFGGIFVIGTANRIAHNTLRRLNLAHCNENAARYGCYYAAGQPDLLRTGIYLGSGADRPDPATGNVIEDNEISGFGMKQHCIEAGPGVSLAGNSVRGNRCAND